MKGGYHVSRKGFKKFRRNLKLSLSKAHGALDFSVWRKRTNFGNRDVPLTQKD